MNKKDVLIKIRHEEERAREAILAAERERDQRIEAARIEAASLQESLAETFSRRYKEEVDKLSSTETPDEQALDKEVAQMLKTQYETGMGNMQKAVDVMFSDFVRYIDAKTEEDE